MAAGGDDLLDAFFKSFPVGYRFEPLEEELVVSYLMTKVWNLQVPPNRILDTNVYHYHPQELHEKVPNYGEKERYYFTPTYRKYPNGNRPNRAARNGFWKATGSDQKVLRGKQLVGIKKVLVFYEGTHKDGGKKTNWIMQEFRLLDQHTPQRQQEDRMLLNECVLCKIYLHQNTSKDKENGDDGDDDDDDDDEPVQASGGYQPSEVENGDDQEDIISDSMPTDNLSIEVNEEEEEEEVETDYLKEEDVLVPAPGQGEKVLAIEYQPSQMQNGVNQDTVSDSLPMNNSPMKVKEEEEKPATVCPNLVIPHNDYIFDPLPFIFSFNSERYESSMESCDPVEPVLKKFRHT